jgi:hypothetical protein
MRRDRLDLPDMKLIQAKKNAKNLFINLVMPLLVMTVRLEIHVIFHLSYNNFFNNIGPSGNKQIVSNGHPDNPAMPLHVTKTMRLMNGVISEIIDPDMYYSRLSFLESGKDAIDIKNELL